MSYVVICKTYPVVNKRLENWHAVAPCTTLQLVDIKLFTLKVYDVFFISNFRRVLYDVCFLLGNSPASEFYMSTFRNTLSVPSS